MGEHNFIPEQVVGPVAEQSAGSTELIESVEAAHADERLHGIITEQRFIEPYKQDIAELFKILGVTERLALSEDWEDHPEERQRLLEFMKQAWIGTEHGAGIGKQQFTPEQVEAALAVFEQVGMRGETLPPDGSKYDQIVVLGGTMTANYRRLHLVMDMIQNRHIEAKQIVILTGVRKRASGDKTDADLLSADAGEFPGNDVSEVPWIMEMINKVAEARAIQEDRLAEGQYGPADPRPQIMSNEADLVRLAMHKVLPGAEKASPAQIRLRVTDITGMNESEVAEALPQKIKHKKGDVPPQRETEFIYRLPLEVDGQQRMQEFRIVVAEAVDRGPEAEPRTTTLKQVAELAARDLPPRRMEPHPEALTDLNANHDPRELLLSGNPHTARTASDTYEMFKAAGRGDIILDVAGTSTSSRDLTLYAGELARLIEHDLLRNYQHNPEQPAA